MNEETANSAKSESKKPSLTVPLDTAWFDREPERYLSREDFVGFQKIVGVDFRDLLSKDPAIKLLDILREKVVKVFTGTQTLEKLT